MVPHTSSVSEMDWHAGSLRLLAKKHYIGGPALLRMFQHWRPYICPFEKLMVHVGRDSSVLDIGCGSGLFLTLLAAVGRCRSGVGVDSSQPAIELARLAAAELSKSGCTSELTFLCQDAQQQLPAGPFDVVSLVDVMHHVRPEAADSVIESAAARLAPHGILVYKDMRSRPLWRAWANRLHDLVTVRQWIHYCPIEKVERAAARSGLIQLHGSEFDRLWYAHQLRVFQRNQVCKQLQITPEIHLRRTGLSREPRNRNDRLRFRCFRTSLLKSHSTDRQARRNSTKAVAALGPTPSEENGTVRGRWKLVGPVLAGIVASILLFWGLSEKYLWQDEANTAVLGTRILRFGRPLAYDGVNLLTIDHYAAEDIANIEKRAGDPKATVNYYVDHRAYRPDTAWTFHPWGQFFVAAASFKIFGQTTFAARLPFALAALATIVLLYQLIRIYCKSDSMALIAAALLICNAFWILHGRQCRYYALSSLFLVLTLTAYMRWQNGARWGATAFVISGWAWFQVDYGTVWPVFGVLSLDACWTHRRNPWRTLCAGLALGAMIAPFTSFYHLTRRASIQGGGDSHEENYRYWFNALNMNEYVVPLVVVAAATALLIWRWKAVAVTERRLVAIASGTICAISIWVPTITSDPFLRYIIMAAPIGCLLSAWLLVRGCQGKTAYAWIGAAVLILTPWLRIPLKVLNPPISWYSTHQTTTNWMYKSELVTLLREVFTPPPDPNRMVIEWLRQNTKPTDEILINYEDIPLMFYLPNPIRGGIEAFRAEDNTQKPPDVLVIRRSVGFVHWNVFAREINRYRWSVAPIAIPDVVWGNNPDPMAQSREYIASNKIILAKRTETGSGRGVVFGSPQP